jgi:hypothetical protein
MRAYVRFGLNKMANLEKFDNELQEAFAAVTPISHHHVELKDGRIINRDVFPLFQDSNHVGWIATLN